MRNTRSRVRGGRRAGDRDTRQDGSRRLVSRSHGRSRRPHRSNRPMGVSKRRPCPLFARDDEQGLRSFVRVAGRDPCHAKERSSGSEYPRSRGGVHLTQHLEDPCPRTSPSATATFFSPSIFSTGSATSTSRGLAKRTTPEDTSFASGFGRTADFRGWV